MDESEMLISLTDKVTDLYDFVVSLEDLNPIELEAILEALQEVRETIEILSEQQ